MILLISSNKKLFLFFPSKQIGSTCQDSYQWEMTSHSSNNILGICQSIKVLSKQTQFKFLDFVPVVADVAIVYKWWLRAFSKMDLGQEFTSSFVFYFSNLLTKISPFFLKIKRSSFHGTLVQAPIPTFQVGPKT